MVYYFSQVVAYISPVLKLQRAPKALLLQYIVVGKLNMVEIWRLSRTSSFVPTILSIV
jgi:hypothetical protein